MDNNLINNRPKELFDIEYYTELPQLPFELEVPLASNFLGTDIFLLSGIMPKTVDLIEKTGICVFTPRLSEKEVEYYRSHNTKFQMINIVANIHTFKRSGNSNKVLAYPYSISLVAAAKRNLVDERTIELLKNFDFERISEYKSTYTDFCPFKPIDTGFYNLLGLLWGNGVKQYTDTIGFVLGTYFLPTDINLNDIPMFCPGSIDLTIAQKYAKYRIKRFYKPFSDIFPRRIWGCDSPIELFLVQALAQQNVFPTIQALIFNNGCVFDNYYQMVESNIFIKGDELVTAADFYFPEKKLAIFCDSIKYHTRTSNINKDKLIDDKLNDLGIKSLRISGKDIVNNLKSCVDRIIVEL